MLRIIIGSSNSTLSKLNAYAVGEALKNKNQDLFLEYVHHNGSSQEKQVPVDIYVSSTHELEPGDLLKSNVYTVLGRADQREIILFKKNLLSLKKEEIKLLSLSCIHPANTEGFLNEYLPISIQKKKITIQSFGSDPTTLIKQFQNLEVDGIILPIAILSRYLSSHLLKEHDDEEVRKMRKFVNAILEDSIFMIPPLSLCPNFPAEGFLFAEVKNPTEQILNLIRSISDGEMDKIAQTEKENIHSGSISRTVFLKRAYGMIEYSRSQNISTCRLLEACTDQFDISEIWPPNARMAPRQRERLGYKIPPDSDLYVSRGYAFPLDLNSDPKEQILWAAGLSTWKDLSNRNLWVHGTNDGLGESEPIRLSTLLGRKLKFVKLSHLDSDTSNNTFPLISTYRLSSPEIPDEFDPSKIKAAFWRSSSEFERITNRFPELKEVIHFVSPGSTYTKIVKELGHKPNFQLHVALSFESWRQQNVLPSPVSLSSS